MPGEQEAIRTIHAMHEAGLSLRVIADSLGADGFSLSHAGVKKVLSRRRSGLMD